MTDKENENSVSNSITTLNEVAFEIEESFILNQSTLSTLNYKLISDPFEKLENTRLEELRKAAKRPQCNSNFMK